MGFKSGSINGCHYYSGCHEYVPFAGFSNKRNGGMSQSEIISNMATDVLAALLARAQPHRAHLADDTACWFNNHVYKTEEKLLERLDQAQIRAD
jgi:hypothetical protein